MDRAEDPEKIVRLIVTEMEETLVEIRANTAGYLADKKSFERKLDKLQQQSTHWQEKAELALSKDREDLARAALIEKQKADEQKGQIEADIAKLDEILAALQEDSARLNEKMADAKAKQNAMTMRQNCAVTRLKVREQAHRSDIDDAIARFDSFESKIDDLEAQIEAYDTTNVTLLSAEFRKLETNNKVDDELDALKKKVANG